MEMNRELARELAALVQPIPKMCYLNSVLALRELQGKPVQALYVEGVLFTLSIYIEHGWLEVDGCIVDVTLHDCKACDYHPVFRYTLQETEGELPAVGQRRRLPDLPLFDRDREDRRKIHETLNRLYFP